MTHPAAALQTDTGQWRQQTLQAGLDLLDQGLSVFDADLKLVAWNRAFLQLLDFPPELAFVGADFESFIRYNAERGEYGEHDVEAAVASRVAKARLFVPHDIERMRPDGSVLRITGQPLPGHGFVTLYSDVTQQRRAEQALRQANTELESRVLARTAELQASTQRLRLVTDSIPALVGYFRADRTYTYVNRRYHDWFGLDPQQPDAVRAREFLGADVYERIKPYITRALAGEAVTFDYELHTVAGQILAVRTTLVPDIAADGQVQGCFELTFDVTQEKQSQALIVRAQKMKAMGQLTGGLAHDFNNILTVIIGNLSALADARPQDPLVAEFTGPAIAAARRGAELIRGVMTFARPQPVQAAAVDVVALAQSVARLVRPALPVTVQLDVEAGDEPAWTWVDPTQLENALVNLILNARDAIRAQGRIVLRTAVRTVEDDEAQRLRVQPGSFVYLDVVDDGVGMDTATVAHIFEPFFTTKQAGSGTGLGMSMVYGFVRQSGGGVQVDSTPGQGTTVSLCLPAIDVPTDVPALDEAEGAADRSRRGVALLVEDDPDVRRVVRRSLLDLGFAVIEATHAQEAQDILAQMPDIKLLLSDIMMPGEMNGVGLARLARQQRPDMQILLMSGGAAGGDDLGQLTVLAKPFSTRDLAAALEGLTP